MSPAATGVSIKGLTQLPPAPLPISSALRAQPVAQTPTPLRAPPPPPSPPPPTPLPQNSIKHHEQLLNTAVLHVAPYPPSPQQLPIFLVGISGGPSSGKTTLSGLLIQIFPLGTISFIFDEDSYGLSSKSSRSPNYDPREVANSDQLISILKELKGNGFLSSNFKAPQPPQSRSRDIEHLLKSEVVQELREEVAEKFRLVLGDRKIGIVEGLLPYEKPLVKDLLDVMLFLPVSKATAKEKRLARFGHEQPLGRDYWRTLEDFENVVWPNYARVCGYLFRHGDVEGSVKKRMCREFEIDVRPGLHGSMEDSLRWAVDVIVGRLKVPNERSIPTDIGGPNDRYELCDCRDGVLGRVRRFLFDLL